MVRGQETQDKSWTNCIAYWIWKHAAHTVMAKFTLVVVVSDLSLNKEKQNENICEKIARKASRGHDL
jgi:hypothetical protein